MAPGMLIVGIVPGFSSDPPPKREYGGWMETTGKIDQIEITENSLFYCSPTI